MALGTVVYSTTSDYRLKDNVRTLDGLALVNMLSPVEFNWTGTSTDVGGFLAHEVAEVLPHLVEGPKDGPDMQQMDNIGLIPYLVAAVQELTARVEELS